MGWGELLVLTVRLYRCDGCGRSDQWSESWQWFGSTGCAEGYEPCVGFIACSEACVPTDKSLLVCPHRTGGRSYRQRVLSWDTPGVVPYR